MNAPAPESVPPLTSMPPTARETQQMTQAATPPSEEAPVYSKVLGEHSNLWMITYDEGWRSSILCTGMYERDADWLLSLLGRTPRAAR
jgi:hypothetical protein